MSNTSGRSWPTKRLPDQVGAPSNAATGGVPDLPKPRNSAAATQAMDILADAVWRIDARDHQNAGAPVKVVRNLGTAGSVLDCRTGSTSVPDTNDPLFLPVQDRAYVYFPGVDGNGMSVPHENALNISGPIDVRTRIYVDTYATSNYTFATKGTGSNTTGWLFTTSNTGNGRLRWRWWNGTAVQSVESSADITSLVAFGNWANLRVTFNPNTGSGYEVKFYVAADGAAYAQLGTTLTGTATTLSTNTSPLYIGTQYIGGNYYNMSGRMTRLQVLNGIDGTTVLDVDTSVLTTGSATSFTAATGQTVTINRSTSGRKTVVVPSSDVKKVDDANVYLPGVAGNYLSVPDATDLRITGDIEIDVDVNMPSWSPATQNTFVAKWNGSGNYGYVFAMGTVGLLQFYWTTNGTTVKTSTATATTGLIGRARVKVTMDVDNGASGNDVKFWKSTDNGVTWTQIGATVTTSGTTSIYASTAVTSIGAHDNGAGFISTASVYRAIVKNGINGTTVLDIDTSIAPTNFTPGYASAFPAVTGQTVTMNSTAGSAMRVNGERWAAGSPVWLFGTDDYMVSPSSGGSGSSGRVNTSMFDFGPNTSFTVFALIRPFATVPASAPVLSTRSVIGTPYAQAGFSFNTQSGQDSSITLADGTTGQNSNNGSVALTPLGQMRPIFAVVSRETGKFTCSSPAGSLAASIIVGQIGSQPLGYLNVGYMGGTGVLSDYELVAAAIWRRALTAAEIQTLTTYYNGRVA